MIDGKVCRPDGVGRFQSVRFKMEDDRVPWALLDVVVCCLLLDVIIH